MGAFARRLRHLAHAPSYHDKNHFNAHGEKARRELKHGQRASTEPFIAAAMDNWKGSTQAVARRSGLEKRREWQLLAHLSRSDRGGSNGCQSAWGLPADRHYHRLKSQWRVVTLWCRSQDDDVRAAQFSHRLRQHRAPVRPRVVGRNEMHVVQKRRRRCPSCIITLTPAGGAPEPAVSRAGGSSCGQMLYKPLRWPKPNIEPQALEGSSVVRPTWHSPTGSPSRSVHLPALRLHAIQRDSGAVPDVTNWPTFLDAMGSGPLKPATAR
jgi:hypothetical protein